jgi:hypothetical protein
MSEYHDIDAKRLGYFVGSIVTAAVAVTVIYCSLYGFRKWTGNVQQGANLMMAASPAPYQTPARTAIAGQFICPAHGAVGLPVFDAAGVPRCPLCKEAMGFNGPQAGVQAGPVGLAAVGGGGG